MASSPSQPPHERRNDVALVPYRELEIASNSWEKTLGSGSFGTVYAGTWRGERVAIKRFHAPDNRDPFNREVAVATVAQHENLLRLLFMVRAPRGGRARAGGGYHSRRLRQLQRTARRVSGAAAFGTRRVCGNERAAPGPAAARLGKAGGRLHSGQGFIGARAPSASALPR